MKTKLFIAFALFALLLVGKLNAKFSGGSGTETDPYQITSREDLEALADSVDNINYWSQGKYFKVMNDITDSVRTVIAWKNMSNHAGFQGNFDGNYKSITLAIAEDPNRMHGGLFGVAVHDASIKNVVVTGYVNASFIAGGIVGMAYNNTKIHNCLNSANITSDYFTGGIVAIAEANEIMNCINIGTIKGQYIVGGIIGTTNSITIDKCINSGFVLGDTEVGGIAGFLGGYSIVKNCLNTGVVKGNTKVGCIVGGVPDFAFGSPTIENCYYDKQMCGGGE